MNRPANMAFQRTRRPSLRSGRSLRSLGSPLNAYPLCVGNYAAASDSSNSAAGGWPFRASAPPQPGKAEAPSWRGQPLRGLLGEARAWLFMNLPPHNLGGRRRNKEPPRLKSLITRGGRMPIH